MSDKTPQPLKSHDFKRRLSSREWLMASAVILGPVTGTLVGVLVAGRYYSAYADEGIPVWRLDRRELIFVATMLFAVTAALWLWVRRRLKEIIDLRCGIATKETELAIRKKDTGELKKILQTKETQLAKGDQEIGGLRALIVARDRDLTQNRKEVSELREALQDRERKLESGSAIRMVHPAEYIDVLRNLASTHGPGHLLLFNIELNTFTDDPVFERLWGRLAELSEITTVRIALPRRKFQRWEKIVTGIREEFFRTDTNGQKFLACEYAESQQNAEDRIAFALYDSIRDPQQRDWGALFLLNRPFVEGRADGTHDYLHVLEYRGSHEALSRCRTLWGTVYESDWAQSAEEIQRFHRQLRDPPELNELIKQPDNLRVFNIRQLGGVQCVFNPFKGLLLLRL